MQCWRCTGEQFVKVGRDHAGWQIYQCMVRAMADGVCKDHAHPSLFSTRPAPSFPLVLRPVLAV